MMCYVTNVTLNYDNCPVIVSAAGGTPQPEQTWPVKNAETWKQAVSVEMKQLNELAEVLQ